MGMQRQTSPETPAHTTASRICAYLGTTLWIAWNMHFLVLSPASSALFARPAPLTAQLAVVGGCLLGALALAAASWRRRMTWYSQPFVLALALVCAVAACAFYLIPWQTELPVPLLLLTGASTFVVTTAWMNIIAGRNSSIIYQDMGATTAVGALGSYTLYLLEGSALGACLGVVAALVSLGCFVFTARLSLATKTDPVLTVPTASGGGLALPPKALAVGVSTCALLGLVLGICARTATPIPTSPLAGWAVAGIATAACAFLLVGHRYRQFDRLGSLAMRMMAVLVLCGLFMLQAPAAFPAAPVGFALAAGFILFHLYSKGMYLEIARQMRDIPLAVFAQAWAANYGAALAGSAAAALLPAALLQMPGVSVLALAVSLALAAVAFTGFSDQNLQSCWGLVRAVPGQEGLNAPGASAAGSDALPAGPGPFRLAAEQVAAGAGLTPRESEVFCLLVRGYRANQIEELLGISLGTVRNHINRSYAKLHIHSYAQAQDLVEARREKLEHADQAINRKRST